MSTREKPSPSATQELPLHQIEVELDTLDHSSLPAEEITRRRATLLRMLDQHA